MQITNYSRRKSSPAMRAFTLVELLVVIGIIARADQHIYCLRMAKATPKSANDAACKSNLRQIVMAMLMYTNDNKNCLPNLCLYSRFGRRPRSYYEQLNPADPLAIHRPGLWGEGVSRKYLKTRSPEMHAQGARPANYFLGATYLRCPEAQASIDSVERHISGRTASIVIDVVVNAGTRKPGIFEPCIN